MGQGVDGLGGLEEQVEADDGENQVFGALGEWLGVSHWWGSREWWGSSERRSNVRSRLH